MKRTDQGCRGSPNPRSASSRSREDRDRRERPMGAAQGEMDEIPGIIEAMLNYVSRTVSPMPRGR